MSDLKDVTWTSRWFSELMLKAEQSPAFTTSLSTQMLRCVSSRDHQREHCMKASSEESRLTRIKMLNTLQRHKPVCRMSPAEKATAPSLSPSWPDVVIMIVCLCCHACALLSWLFVLLFQVFRCQWLPGGPQSRWDLQQDRMTVTYVNLLLYDVICTVN